MITAPIHPLRRVSRTVLYLKFLPRTFGSASRRIQTSRLSRCPNRLSTDPDNLDLWLGQGRKAPGFVQQMLFSAPVQEKISNSAATKYAASRPGLRQISKKIGAVFRNSEGDVKNVQEHGPISASPYKFPH